MAPMMYTVFVTHSFFNTDSCEDHGLREQYKKTRQSASEFAAALKQCSKARDLEGGKKLHFEAVVAGCHANKYVATALVGMYSKCGSMSDARNIFDRMTNRDTVSWTCLIMGYVENGQSSIAMDLFANMDCEANSVTFIAALKACASLGSEKQAKKEFFLEKGRDIHKKLKQRKLESNLVVATSLVDMYCKCGSMLRAREIFNGMLRKDVVMWNCLLMGYVENGESLVALDLFASLKCEPNCVTFVAALKACAGIACLEKGISIHDHIKERGFESDIVVGNALLDMYSKCGSMQNAMEVFKGMINRSVVSWTCMILGYVENGESAVAMEVFLGMDCQANSVTFVGAVKACGVLTWLPDGLLVHARICRAGLETDESVASCLMDLYGKCGEMARAEQVFDTMHFADVVCWNALISGYSVLGDTFSVFALLREMQDAGVHVDGVTFISILTACGHAGMVEQGKECLESMTGFGISPSLEHYTCIVDMLVRAKRTQDALSIVNSMPFEVDNVTWTSLLDISIK